MTIFFIHWQPVYIGANFMNPKFNLKYFVEYLGIKVFNISERI